MKRIGKIKMNKKIQLAIKTALAGVALTGSIGASYAGTVSTEAFDSGSTTLVAGSSLIASTQAATNHTFTDNPSLNYSAWAHLGKWYNFEVTSAIDTTINITATDTSKYSPAFTVYRTDGAWGGGTATFSEFGVSATARTPHNFNATGNIGDNGTKWMQQGESSNTSDSNAIATLAYANSGQAHHAGETNWGEHVHTGINSKDGALTYTNGISGSVGMGMTEMILADLDTGWYTIYTGGADASKLGSTFTVTVSAVPVPAAVYLFGTALLGLFSARRKALSA